jgi:hypothetical protein
MVRNDPQEPFQRRNLIDRVSSSHAVRACLIGAIHGYSSEETKKPATLLVFSFSFLPHKRNVRIKSVNITIEFDGRDDDPAVVAMVPKSMVNGVSQPQVFPPFSARVLTYFVDL